MATNSPVRRRPVPAVARALAILRLLGDSEHALGVQTIARETGMVPSTCLHILRELAEENLVAFDDSTKRYTLDAGILALVDKMLRRKPLAHTVQPSLDRLTRRFSISACLMQISGAGHMVVIGVSNRADLGVKIDLGTLVPVLASATGRCVAASYSPQELRKAFQALRWAKAPPFNVWLAEMADSKKRGYGVDNGNYGLGLTVVSAPILDALGRISHAVVVFGIREQVEQIGIEKIAEELKAIAAPFSSGSPLLAD